MKQITISADARMLDEILHQLYDADYRKYLAPTLALNPGLAQRGLYLPRGVVLRLPEAAATEAPKRVVSLFD